MIAGLLPKQVGASAPSLQDDSFAKIPAQKIGAMTCDEDGAGKLPCFGKVGDMLCLTMIVTNSLGGKSHTLSFSRSCSKNG